ncbi:sensor histidine kinase [Halolactibacillus sp. JCM 19043]|nr:sensor histidine kinase [Halolactibacillus sp. JCM 19043]
MLNDAIHNVSIQGELYLLDAEDRVLFTTDQNHREGTIFTENTDVKEPYITRQMFTDQYIADWSVVTVVDESIYRAELSDSTKYILLLGLMNFILPAFLIIYLSRSFHSRLNNILDHTRHIEKKNFAEYPHVRSKDEIGQLANQINRMTRKMNELFNEVFKANLEKKELALREKEAQLSALQSQINPHFLFNALETIRMRSIMKDETETALMIENMAGIFRNSLKWGSNWVTVLDEVRLIQAFLEIQGYRFGERLTYHVYVDEQLADFEIPNLSFLPFVENASLHGIEPKKGTGNIDISITKTALGLRFVIEDDGVGIPESRLIRLQKELQDGATMGENVGIENIYYRLKLYYKDQFRMKIESEEGIGTTVTIDLPMQDSKLQAYLKVSD